MKRSLVLILAAAVLLSLPAFAQKKYKLVDTVKLAGDGGWDYLTFDKEGQRLFITRGTHVMVIDATTLKQVGDITGLSGAHQVALAPELQRGFISNGRNNSITIFDLKTLAVKDTVKIEAEAPDALLYDPSSKHLFSFNGRSKNSTVIDAATGKVIATIPLSGGPESAATDSAGFVYVNIEDKNAMTVIDVNANAVKFEYPIAGCDGPSALALDAEHKRLFSGCWGNSVMTVMNAANGKVVASVPIGKGVDAGAYDPGSGQVFMSCGGAGTLVAIHQDTPDKYSVVQTVATAPGARTMALDPVTKTIYTVTAQFKEETKEGERPKRVMVPGTFELLVLKPE